MNTGVVLERIHHHFEAKCLQAAQEELEEVQKSGDDVRFMNVDAERLAQMFPQLVSKDKSGHLQGHMKSESSHGGEKDELLPADGGAEALLQAHREMLLRGVTQIYWEDLEAGIISRTSRVARILLYSAEDAMLNVQKPLDDWSVVLARVCGTTACPRMNRVVSCCWPLNRIRDLQQWFPTEKAVQVSQVYATIEFWEAHRRARMAIRHYLTAEAVPD